MWTVVAQTFTRCHHVWLDTHKNLLSKWNTEELLRNARNFTWCMKKEFEALNGSTANIIEICEVENEHDVESCTATCAKDSSRICVDVLGCISFLKFPTRFFRMIRVEKVLVDTVSNKSIIDFFSMHWKYLEIYNKIYITFQFSEARPNPKY